MVVRVKWYPLPDTWSHLLNVVCLQFLLLHWSPFFFFFFPKDDLQNALFSQALSVISHRERDNQDHFFLIYLCPSFAYVAWHACVTQWWPWSHRTSDGACHRVDFLLQTVNIQKLNTHLFIIRPPDFLREGMSAGLLRGLKMLHQIIPGGLTSEQLGQGCRRCKDSYHSNFEMAAEQKCNRNQNH